MTRTSPPAALNTDRAEPAGPAMRDSPPSWNLPQLVWGKLVRSQQDYHVLGSSQGISEELVGLCREASELATQPSSLPPGADAVAFFPLGTGQAVAVRYALHSADAFGRPFVCRRFVVGDGAFLAANHFNPFALIRLLEPLPPMQEPVSLQPVHAQLHLYASTAACLAAVPRLLDRATFERALAALCQEERAPVFLPSPEQPWDVIELVLFCLPEAVRRHTSLSIGWAKPRRAPRLVVSDQQRIQGACALHTMEEPPSVAPGPLAEAIHLIAEAIYGAPRRDPLPFVREIDPWLNQLAPDRPPGAELLDRCASFAMRIEKARSHPNAERAAALLELSTTVEADLSTAATACRLEAFAWLTPQEAERLHTRPTGQEWLSQADISRIVLHQRKRLVAGDLDGVQHTVRAWCMTTPASSQSLNQAAHLVATKLLETAAKSEGALAALERLGRLDGCMTDRMGAMALVAQHAAHDAFEIEEVVKTVLNAAASPAELQPVCKALDGRPDTPALALLRATASPQSLSSSDKAVKDLVLSLSNRPEGQHLLHRGLVLATTVEVPLLAARCWAEVGVGLLYRASPEQAAAARDVLVQLATAHNSMAWPIAVACAPVATARVELSDRPSPPGPRPTSLLERLDDTLLRLVHLGWQGQLDRSVPAPDLRPSVADLLERVAERCSERRDQRRAARARLLLLPLMLERFTEVDARGRLLISTLQSLWLEGLGESGSEPAFGGLTLEILTHCELTLSVREAILLEHVLHCLSGFERTDAIESAVNALLTADPSEHVALDQLRVRMSRDLLHRLRNASHEALLKRGAAAVGFWLVDRAAPGTSKDCTTDPDEKGKGSP